MFISIDISFLSAKGTRGSGVDQFDYPSGIIYDSINDRIYICDRQNQRVQIYDLALNHISNFGTYGTGAYQMNFPEGITSDGASLYVTQSANHRITKYKLTGSGLLDFGSLGSGNSQFNYPVDIAYNSPYIYVCDKQNHKIKVFSLNTSPYHFMFDIGGYGTGDTNLNFPESVKIFNNKIVVADSANKQIKFFDLAGGFLSKITNTNFVYPTGLTNIDDKVLMVIDKQGSTLYFYDVSGNLINEYETGLNFPENAVYFDEKIYLTDSANHRIVVLNAFIIEDIPYVSAQLRKLTRQLYPTGRAWWLVVGSWFDKVHQALSYSEGRAYQTNLDLKYAILPDNDNFTAEDATNHESALGLMTNPTLSLTIRKQAIERKIQHPGNIPARQDYRYVQAQLRAAGFDVYVHENRLPVIPAIYGLFNYGQANYGGSGILSSTYTKVANYINESRDATFNLGGNPEQNFLFFVGGSMLYNTANVDISRKNEFRELILKLKPANMVGLLLINYV